MNHANEGIPRVKQRNVSDCTAIAGASWVHPEQIGTYSYSTHERNEEK